MTRNFIFTPDAESDALAIWTYLAENESEAFADQVIEQIYDECEKLAQMPGKGQYRPDLLEDPYKFWRVMSSVIAYRWESKPLHIIAIVHGRRDLQTFFAARDPN